MKGAIIGSEFTNVADQRDIRTLFRPGNAVSRVGLFGGTFDPVHLGHLHVAEEVKDAFGLEKLIIVPAAMPPHKTQKHVSHAGDRLNMVRLCFGNKPGFRISDVELSRKGPSYTIDTLRYFSSHCDSQHELMMVVGADAFFEIHTWRAFGGILEQVPLIVVMRPGDEDNGDKLCIDKANAYLKDKVATGYQWNPSRSCFQHSFKKNIYLFQGRSWFISSTEIRNRVKNGKNVSSLVQKEVYDYIKEKGLYV